MECKTIFKAVLFDVDGTLLDSLQDLADSMNGTLEHFSFQPHESDRYKYFVGDGMTNLVRRALPASVRNDPAIFAGCFDFMMHAYEQNWNKKTRPYPGIPELLDSLTARGIRMSILSNKPDDFTQMVVQELLSLWDFEVIMGEHPPVPRKPDPSSALDIASRLGIPPAEFLYLGDTATDMQTANRAGMFAVGALWGFRTAEELLDSGAKKLIQKPEQLLGLL